MIWYEDLLVVSVFILFYYAPISSVLVFNVTDEQATDTV